MSHPAASHQDDPDPSDRRANKEEVAYAPASRTAQSNGGAAARKAHLFDRDMGVVGQDTEEADDLATCMAVERVIVASGLASGIRLGEATHTVGLVRYLSRDF